MRRGIGYLLGVSVLGGLWMQTAQAQSPVAAEKGLLGVRILKSYRDVLNLYGTPQRIFRFDEFVSLVEAVDSKGNPTGGIKGFGDDSVATTGAGRAGGGGMMGQAGGMGAMMASRMPGGMGGGGGIPGGPPASMMGQMMGAGRGAPTGGGGIPGGPPASMMGQMMGQMRGGGGGLGQAGGANARQEDSFASSGGFIWAYVYPKKELAYEFFFNKDGRLEVIMERGRSLGQPTRRGINLGHTTKNVYSVYGWPDSTEQTADVLALNYNLKYHVHFGLRNNKVISIAVFLREGHRVNYGTGTQLAGGGGAAGRLAGGPDMGGMGATMARMGVPAGGGGRMMPGVASGGLGKRGGDGAD